MQSFEGKCWHIFTIARAHSNTTSVMFSQILSFLLSTGGGGGSGQMHYLANVPGIEHFLAKECSCQGWGSGHMNYLANVPRNEYFYGNWI